ncbi:MAG: ADP-ribosylglycohydrolase family protein [Dehalococcoidia bacterium]|nr:ADP-ribosylglycohydrolase family protein [Dehalococcoidia bacterium]
MSITRTSATHPLRVGWLPTPWLGKVGLTFAPGKKHLEAATGAWQRDLATDIRRLRDEFSADHLVCLVEDSELKELQIEGLGSAAHAAGMAFHRLPIPDGFTPRDVGATSVLVAQIAGWAGSGEDVVIHCKGGLGRAGTIGGCVLRQSGMDVPATFAALAAARGPNCPETKGQRDFIQAFVPAAPDQRSRLFGAVLGAAVGDALGHPTEFLSHDGITRTFGPSGVSGFELWWTRGTHRFAPYTDDTQLAEIVLRALVQHADSPGSLDAVMEAIAANVAKWSVDPQGGHRAPGNSCIAGAERLRAGTPWRQAGGPNAGGCGSVMRAYPFGLLLRHDVARAEQWAVEHSRMTHQAPIALAACAAMAVGVAGEVRGDAPGEVLTEMVEAAGRYDAGTARMAEEALADAANGTDPVAVLERLQGWAAHEAIAAAMFVVARHERDLPGALLEGANAAGDSDSIATLAGALLGARLGIEALPAEWLRDVERSSELRTLAAEAFDVIERR